MCRILVESLLHRKFNSPRLSGGKIATIMGTLGTLKCQYFGRSVKHPTCCNSRQERWCLSFSVL